MRREVKPEMLDTLAPSDPRASGSRADLRRVNFIMGHAGILSRALRDLADATHGRPLQLVELGAGDGTLLLRIARRMSARGVSAQVLFVDRQNIVSAETRREFASLHWPMEIQVADVFDWIGKARASADAMFANLFLHHFQEKPLGNLLRMAAAQTSLFAACEPRRAALGLAATRLLRFLGCNGVTRHDAAVSVRAGFNGGEISALWPAGAGWQLRERAAGLFSHCFVAKRNA